MKNLFSFVRPEVFTAVVEDFCLLVCDVM